MHRLYAQQKAFDNLRMALVNDVMLAFPQFDLPFIVATDASDIAAAAVLSQVIDGRERPIAFYSRGLRKYEKTLLCRKKKRWQW